MSDAAGLRQVWRATRLTVLTAIAFTLFFLVNKSGPIGAANPFAEDPYDAVGSFSVQAALLVSVLNCGRVLRLIEERGQSGKLRLVWRGNFLVLLAILVTLVADGIALVVRSIPGSVLAVVLQAELALMFLLVILCFLWWLAAAQKLPPGAPPQNLTPADAIDDVWMLVRRPVARGSRLLPGNLVGWVGRFSSDRLFGRVPWINPRAHPWRFAACLGIAVGAGLFLAQLREGLPPSLRAGLLVAGIFIGAELAATLTGFALLGGYLGLRPSWHTQK